MYGGKFAFKNRLGYPYYRHRVLTAYVISTSKIGKHANKFVPISFINFLYYKKKECFGNN